MPARDAHPREEHLLLLYVYQAMAVRPDQALNDDRILCQRNVTLMGQAT